MGECTLANDGANTERSSMCICIPSCEHVSELLRYCSLEHRAASGEPCSVEAFLMAVESTAVFKERVLQLGLESFWEAFERQGWTTFGIFAYSSSYTPGSPDDSKFLTDVVKKLLGSEDHQKTALVRRLYFET